MRVLLVGSGGREHALAWKLARSPLLEELFTAPGNPGTAQHGLNLAVSAPDVAGLVQAARRYSVDLVVPGPEVPLALGLADALAGAGIACFGPRQEAAALEASKAMAKELMARQDVPTAPFTVVDEFEEARRRLRAADYPLVVKASGLAAGKGAVVCRTMDEALDAADRFLIRGELGAAGERLVIEGYLQGEEVSLLALTDGRHVLPLLPAQDHKAAWDGDQGPNTGGMGAYAPAPVLPADEIDSVVETVIRPVLAGLARLGLPYRGVLYAGLMKTVEGYQVLEFNVRFGDPEAQALLPLLQTDLLEVLAAGDLAGARLEWRPGACVSVVLAAEGYPGRYRLGLPVRNPPQALDGVVFQAGTVEEGGGLVSAGGRVLNATGWGATLAEAREAAYRLAEAATFPECFYRRDIAARALVAAAA